MAPLVLGLGIPSTSPHVPETARGPLQKALDAMETDMAASPYDFDMFYVDTDTDFGTILDKLREKKWDLVHVGGICSNSHGMKENLADRSPVGLRIGPALTPFFERVVNAAHEEVPAGKFAFCTDIVKTQEAYQRVLLA